MTTEMPSESIPESCPDRRTAAKTQPTFRPPPQSISALYQIFQYQPQRSLKTGMQDHLRICQRNRSQGSVVLPHCMM